MRCGRVSPPWARPLLWAGPLLGVTAALWATPAVAREVQLDGRASLRGLYSTDSGDHPRVGILFLDTDARAEGLTDAGLRAELDAGFILDATDARERRFGQTESLDQVRQLFVEQADVVGDLGVAAGRRLIAEAGNAWVDGVDLELSLDGGRATLGLYGGLAPDRLDYSLDTDQQATGVYGTLHREGLDTSLAYNAQLRGGALDRHYGFHRIHYRVAPGLFVASYLLVDFLDGPGITTLLASADYTPVPALNVALNVSRYSVERYRDETVYRNVVEPNQVLLLGDEVVDLVYDRVRLSVSLRFWGSLYQYQSLEFKARSQDGREAWIYTIGLRDEDLLGAGTRVDLRTTFDNDFQSDALLVALDVEQDLGARLIASGRATWFDGRTVGRATERGRTFDEAQRVVLVGAALGWRATKAHRIDVDYDGVYETELQDARNQEDLFIHTLMGRYSWLF